MFVLTLIFGSILHHQVAQMGFDSQTHLMPSIPYVPVGQSVVVVCKHKATKKNGSHKQIGLSASGSFFCSGYYTTDAITIN
jgi:hypothetical protein